MNDNSKKWVEALRSGQYQQGTGGLCGIYNHHCCLGVACRIFQEEVGGLQIKLNSRHKYFAFDIDSAYLPNKVRSWLGLTNRDGDFKGGSLASLNDRGSSFKEIADVIESEPDGLFV